MDEYFTIKTENNSIKKDAQHITNKLQMKFPVKIEEGYPVKDEVLDIEFIAKEEPHFPIEDDSKKWNINDLSSEEVSRDDNVENQERPCVPWPLSIHSSGVKGARMGVWTETKLPRGLTFGPYEGRILNKIHNREDSGNEWKIQDKGNSSMIIDADTTLSNWLHFITCSQTYEKANFAIFQYRGQIYNKTLTEINRNAELMMWYCDEAGIVPGYQLENHENSTTWVKGTKTSHMIFSPESSFLRKQNSTLMDINHRTAIPVLNLNKNNNSNVFPTDYLYGKPLQETFSNSQLESSIFPFYKMLNCDNSSDSDYILSISDTDSDSEFSHLSYDDSEVEETIVEVKETATGWKFLSDPFSDNRPDALSPLVQTFAGINPSINMKDKKCSKFFKLFISDEVIEYLCACTNEHAEEYFTQNPNCIRKIYKLCWRNVTSDEMYTFLALFLYTGLVKFSEMHQYWQRSAIFPGIYFFCKDVMSRDRYFTIMKFLRFTNVADVQKGNAQTRIEPFCDILREKCKYLVDAGEHIAVDEALLLWKGRLAFRQYIKSKRSRFGIKLFVMCPSGDDLSGYTWNFSIYYGKDTYQLPFPICQKLSVSERIVVFLVQCVLDEGRHIIVDNWYSSLRLAQYLESRKTYMTGTIRQDRGPPKEIMSEKSLPKHSSVFARSNNVLVVRWVDKRDVLVITTKYTASLIEKNKTYYGGTSKFYYKPGHIEQYNAYMNSVNKADQLLELYNPCRKSLAWFKKLGLHLIARMTMNAFLLHHKQSNEKKLSYSAYLANLVEELLENHTNGGFQRAKQKYFETVPCRGSKRKRNCDSDKPIHTLLKIPATEKVQRPQKKCRICPGRKVTRTHCIGCPEKPGLCSAEHFQVWHSQHD